jgi:hypothetical protein
MSFKKKEKKQTHTNLVNLSFISQTRNMLNHIPELNQESQFSTNLMLKNETEKVVSI